MKKTKNNNLSQLFTKCGIAIILSLITLLPAISQATANKTAPAVLTPEKETAIKAAVIDKFMNACYQRGLINGVVLVAEKGEVIYRKAFGLAHVEWDVPNTIDTKYYLYTLTQQFTAALVMKLVEEGKLKINGTIKDYLPYYKGENADKITIHHLLTHTHGIPDLKYQQLTLVNSFSTQQFINTFLSGKSEFAPGAQFKFSDITGYTLLAAIIEKVTGKSYETLLREKILEPLQMKNSGYRYDNLILKKFATPYEDIEDEKRALFYWSRINGSSSLYSTVDDLLLWDKALTGNKFLSKKAKAQIYKEHVPSTGSGHYGYGWNTVNIKSNDLKKKVVWDIGRSSTVIWRVLDDDKVIIILNNILSPKLLEMCIEITNVLYKRSCTVPRKSFVRTLNKTINRQGIEAAITQYQQLRKDHFNEYSFDESELTMLGNYLFSLKRLKEAVEIYKLNLQYYPNSWGLYSRLGQALAVGNNIPAAIQCYETAIKLMPRGEEQAYKEITAIIEKLKEFQKQETEKNKK